MGVQTNSLEPPLPTGLYKIIGCIERTTVLRAHVMHEYNMALASGPAGPVLAGPVFTVIFGTAHAQIMNNVWGRLTTCRGRRVYATRTFCAEL